MINSIRPFTVSEFILALTPILGITSRYTSDVLPDTELVVDGFNISTGALPFPRRYKLV
jgi:hypothetical protein